MIKLFLLQVVHKKEYREQADHQYATPSSDIFQRGSIFFRRKDGQLISGATQANGYKVAINPNEIDGEYAYEKLYKIIDIEYNQFINISNKKGDPYEEIAHHVSKEQADSISSLKIKGVSIFKEKWRFYPGDNLASHLLGFVAYKGDTMAGRYGLERQYNDILGVSESTLYVNFFAEVFSNIKNTLSSNENKSGDLVTTIEPNVQNFLENKLIEVKQKYNIDSIGGIIMNPKDGSIYAMSIKPDFNINNFSKITDMSAFSNPLVENVLEFGSVVKPLVMASALDAGVVKRDTTYNDKGMVLIDNKREIYNFDKKGRGPNTSMQDVLNQSLNTGMVFVYKNLGKQKMYDYMMSYGLKEKTGIDLPNETSGLVSNLSSGLKNSRDIEYANASFGQGIAMTPIEAIRALASLSNGGNLVVPHLVDTIKYEDGTEKKITYNTIRTKISEKTSEEITSMLVTVMDKSFQQNSPGIEHFSIAVKTGTAQVANPNGGGYYEDRHNHSFFGYFPAYDPKFIILLYAINPKGVLYASQTWANPFLDITKFILNYYEIPTDR
ncbi:MAG: penicillin-binding protein 2 [Candidatus Paceibacterota bacterium]